MDGRFALFLWCYAMVVEQRDEWMGQLIKVEVEVELTRIAGSRGAARPCK